MFDALGALRLSNAAFAALWDLPEIRPLPGGAEAAGAALRFHEVADLQSRLLADGAGRQEFIARMVRVFHERAAADGLLAHREAGTVRWRSAPLADGGLVLSFDAAPPRPAAEEAADVAALLADGVRSVEAWGEVLGHAHYGALNSRQQAYVDSIRDAAAAMERLLAAVDQLRDPAILDDGTAAADVHALLSQVLGAARERAKRREVDLHFDCQPAIGVARLSAEAFACLLGLILDMALVGTSPGDAISLAAQRELGRPAPDRRRYRRGLDVSAEGGHDRARRRVCFGDPRLRGGAGLGLRPDHRAGRGTTVHPAPGVKVKFAGSARTRKGHGL